MRPSLRNLFTKWLTRDRVVPTISAKVSWMVCGFICCGLPSFRKCASSKNSRRSFYRTFKVGPEDTKGRLLYKLGDGHWNIPKLLPAGWAVGFACAAQPAPLRGSPD